MINKINKINNDNIDANSGKGAKKCIFRGSRTNKVAKNLGTFRNNAYLCSKLLKLRHSFLNGHGRPRTAFLVYRHCYYGTTRNVLH